MTLELKVKNALLKRPGVTRKELVKLAGITPGQMDNVLNRLRGKKMIRQDRDTGVVRYYFVESGQALKPATRVYGPVDMAKELGRLIDENRSLLAQVNANKQRMIELIDQACAEAIN